MYGKINQAFRQAMINAAFSYQNQVMEVYHQGDWGDDDGAHIRTAMFTLEPEYKEIGSYIGNIARVVEGYFQIGVFLPSTDKGLDFSMNKFADEIDDFFKRGTGGDIEYLSVEREDVSRIGGHEALTCRVNFRMRDCISV